MAGDHVERCRVQAIPGGRVGPQAAGGNSRTRVTNRGRRFNTASDNSHQNESCASGKGQFAPSVDHDAGEDDDQPEGKAAQRKQRPRPIQFRQRRREGDERQRRARKRYGEDPKHIRSAEKDENGKTDEEGKYSCAAKGGSKPEEKQR
jgi:hypothetical protein